MHFGFTEEEKEFQKQVREFMDREVTRGVVQEFESFGGPGPHMRELVRKMGERGWLTPHWPKEFGGLDGNRVQMLIVYDEISYYNAVSFGGLVGPTIAGPTILLFGREEQKRKYLRPIALGETYFALGYTEPQAGSDLASIEMQATENSDSYVMNGQKIFSSAAHFSDYHWLAARTDPEAPKHKGLSLFIVDLKSPGISILPLHTQYGERTNIVYYDDVRVPKENLVGEKNRGFYHMAVALDLERIFPTGELRRFFSDLVAYVRSVKVFDKDLGKDSLVRQRIAEMAVELEVGNLLSYRLAWIESEGRVPNYEASMEKLYVTEMAHRMAKTALKILSLYGQLMSDSKYTQLGGRARLFLIRNYVETIVAGTSEIQRNIMATRGLGLPRG